MDSSGGLRYHQPADEHEDHTRPENGLQELCLIRQVLLLVLSYVLRILFSKGSAFGQAKTDH